ncbi:tryptophan-rich sensory protein [Geminocystis sp. GBBB08]|uniref:TspO/MBR family protein n=1 Tax=Geminocystis sp. GBBB08 TaxID=2604140 RepID=UPI0027E3A8C3|nr:tryptophan-rich sensory protein [Geminocystis sp. GBBB08]MBL1209084.1 TspO protein [Geminocystis sp. GBBB08]
MLPSWLIIGAIAFLVSLLINRIPTDDLRWFFRLRRPDWLTFEFAIPFIWIFIFVSLILSASIIWDTDINIIKKAILMTLYLGLEVAILAYTRVMCAMRSLMIGVLIGGGGFLLGLFLAVLVFFTNKSALYLLIPYLLWSPIGTYVTWAMIPLNRDFI